MARALKKTGIEAQLRSLEDIVKKLEDGTLPWKRAWSSSKKAYVSAGNSRPPSRPHP